MNECINGWMNEIRNLYQYTYKRTLCLRKSSRDESDYRVLACDSFPLHIKICIFYLIKGDWKEISALSISVKIMQSIWLTWHAFFSGILLARNYLLCFFEIWDKQHWIYNEFPIWYEGIVLFRIFNWSLRHLVKYVSNEKLCFQRTATAQNVQIYR